VLLEEISTKNQICVATTHTYWDPKLSDLKVLQAAQLLIEIEV
jgi:mRNA deadenylase 3'-5' endonuclease subunit Ccr4